MAKVTIFVEGTNDAIFLKNLILFIYGVTIEVKEDNDSGIGRIVNMGGSNRHKQSDFSNIFEKSHDAGYKNILFEDADLIKNSKGFDVVNAYLAAEKDTLHFDYFIFPNHAEKEGYLESLLVKLAQNPILEQIECAKTYYACLARNGKFYDHHTQWKMISGTLLEDKNFDFSKKDKWHILGNPAITHLQNFLNRYFLP